MLGCGRRAAVCALGKWSSFSLVEGQIAWTSDSPIDLLGYGKGKVLSKGVAG